MQFPDHSFWDFSLATYGRTGVSEACLALQEAHGADVNILLFCAWAGCNGASLDRKRVEAACAAVDAWHREIVRPLRSVRQRLKTALDECPPGGLQPALRARIQKIELDAEHIEQLRLAALADDVDDVDTGAATLDEAAARTNMKTYLSVIEADMAAETRAAIDAIAAAACSTLATR